MRDKRFTIGLVVANIADPFSNRIARGAMAVAEKLDLNLIIFPVKYVDIDYVAKESDAKFEYQCNALLSYAAAGKLDYLIVCVGTIAYISGDARKKEILSFLSDTPVLSVSAKIDGFDYIQYDNTTGITDAVNYLVQFQNRRHICIMAGNLNNYECAERFHAYKNALEANGITYEDRFMIESDVSFLCADEAEKLCDANPEMDAVICVNDDMARTFYDVLKKRNISIGIQVAVVGFDDLPFAAKLEPPLSSIKADAVYLGEQSVERVYRILNGEIITDHNVPTTFIKRESCNYRSDIQKSAEGIFDCSDDEAAENIIRYVFSDLSDEKFINEVRIFCRGLAEKVRKTFFGRIADVDDIRALSEYIGAFFDSYEGYVNIVGELYAVADECYHWILDNSPQNSEGAKILFNLFSKKIAGIMASAVHEAEENNIHHSHMSNVVTRDALMFTDNHKESYANILQKLHCIGVHTSYLYLLDNPKPYINGEFFPVDNNWLFKSYQYGTGCFTVPEEKQNVNGVGLYKNDYIDSGRRMTLLAADLYTNELQYGLLLVEPGDASIFYKLEFIAYQFSAAVRIIELLTNQEKMLNELHMNNLVLHNMSNVDELTGIYNRRGFYYMANEMISKPENKGRKLMVCYADMDKLKMVNDNYGHIEGDYSLRALAGCMKDMMTENGISGRLGGDEFVGIGFADELGSIEDITGRRDEYIRNLNQTSGKPYYIGMSVGIYECVCENSYDLKTALDKADDVLYVAKADRKKNDIKKYE